MVNKTWVMLVAEAWKAVKANLYPEWMFLPREEIFLLPPENKFSKLASAHEVVSWSTWGICREWQVLTSAFGRLGTQPW